MNLIFFDRAKAHLVPAGLGRVVSQEIWDRFKGVAVTSTPKANQAVRFDKGGPQWDGHWVSVKVDETFIEVPVRHIGAFYMDLLEAKPRFHEGHTYYKLHSELHVIVLSPLQRRMLLSQWSMHMPEYRRIAERERARLTNTPMEDELAVAERRKLN